MSAPNEKTSEMSDDPAFAMIELPALEGRPSRLVPASEAFATGQKLHAQGNTEIAQNIYEKILAVDVKHGDATFYLGMLLCQNKKFEQAFELLKRAVRMYPNVLEYHYNLGLIYESLDNYPDAIICYRKVVALQPDGHWHCTIGKELSDSGQLDEAIEFGQEALKLLPVQFRAIAHNNLGIAYTLKGEMKLAIDHYRQSITMDIENALAQSNYLMTLNYLADPDLKEIFSEHKKYGDKFESFFPRLYENPIEAQARRAERQKPNHKIRVGYISPDFYGHAVGQFIEPILAAHNSAQFDVYCYYNNTRIDDFTKRIQDIVPQNRWRNIWEMPNEDIARLIQKDEIDILVDLSGHTALNKLIVFVSKPAPIQVTWIGYPNTTGLSTMDYRITDSFADPVGEADTLHTEKLVRLPECFSCFKAPQQSPDVGPLPALANGHITIGSFNNFAKLTPQVMRVWIDILNRLPHSKLILKNRSLANPRLKKFIMGELKKCGAQPEQIDLLSPNVSPVEHLNCYNFMDIGLDPFPYNGTTTTLDALWMGVPVITLAGNNHVSRVGVSQMNNLGLPELIARDIPDYIEKTVALAQDLPRLTQLRANMRERVRASPLMDAPRFTKHLEAAYLDMWKKYLSSVAL